MPKDGTGKVKVKGSFPWVQHQAPGVPGRIRRWVVRIYNAVDPTARFCEADDRVACMIVEAAQVATHKALGTTSAAANRFTGTCLDLLDYPRGVALRGAIQRCRHRRLAPLEQYPRKQQSPQPY
jgi:hypothetical protein